MASAAQIAANRLNAQKSTGPRTRRGKAAMRRNPVRHGLSAATAQETAPAQNANWHSRADLLNETNGSSAGKKPIHPPAESRFEPNIIDGG